MSRLGTSIRIFLGPVAPEEWGLADREPRLLWEKPAMPWWNKVSSPPLTRSPASFYQSDWSLCQLSLADGHVHVLGLCPGCTVLLTSCGLWSWKGRFRGWCKANTACAGLPRKAASMTTGQAQQGFSAPAQSSQWACRELLEGHGMPRVSPLKKTEVPCNACYLVSLRVLD